MKKNEAKTKRGTAVDVARGLLKDPATLEHLKELSRCFGRAAAKTMLQPKRRTKS